MLGVVAERVPKGGALALALMGGMGMLASGMIASPWLGKVADEYLPQKLDFSRTVSVLEDVVKTYAPIAAESKEPFKKEIMAAVDDAQKTLDDAKKSNKLPAGTANTLRHAVGASASAPGSKDAKELVGKVKAVLDPADNFGGRMSFRKIAPFAIIIIIVFGYLYIHDRRRGGYKVEKIGA